MLEVRQISVSYSGRTVVHEISFTAAAGEVIALLGPNGAGKTTLLRTLNGTVRPTAGSVFLDERPLAELSRREIARRIAVVAQENETKFPVTVADFVLAARFAHGRAFGWETTADHDAVERAMAACELSEFAGRAMNELSGGERQRVVLARALATGADILLLDEPTANLDLRHQASMFRLVRERCRSCRSTAVVVTHDLNLAAEFADRILLLKNGRLAAGGEPETALTSISIADVYGVEALIDRNPRSGKLRITPVY